MERDKVIDDLWEYSNHGTTKEDVIKIFEAGETFAKGATPEKRGSNGIICQECFQKKADVQDNDGTYLCLACRNLHLFFRD